MKCFYTVMMLAAAAPVWSAEAGRVVRVCLNPGAEAVLFLRARAVADQILRPAEVKVEWTGNVSACAGGEGVLIAISRETPADSHPGALGYALPFDHTHIVVFLDRVRGTAGSAASPYLLGHVLAHEIVHVLQGLDQHSGSGLMKAHWNFHDFAEMMRGGLRLSDDDTALVHHGMGTR